MLSFFFKHKDRVHHWLVDILKFYICQIQNPFFCKFFWEEILVSLFSYSAIDCRAPGQGSNSTVSFDQTTFRGIASYTCLDGYQVLGDTSTNSSSNGTGVALIRTCQANGTWSNQPLQCTGMYPSGKASTMLGSGLALSCPWLPVTSGSLLAHPLPSCTL